MMTLRGIICKSVVKAFNLKRPFLMHTNLSEKVNEPVHEIRGAHDVNTQHDTTDVLNVLLLSSIKTQRKLFTS